MRALFVSLFIGVQMLGAEPIQLIRADLMRNVPVGDLELQELEGDVRVLHQGMWINFSFGRYNRQSGVLHCIRDVVAIHEGDTLTTDELTFYEDEEKTIARGHVIYRGDSLECRSREATWWRGLGHGELRSEVLILDQRNKLELECDAAWLDNEQGYARATRGPVLRQLEEDGVVLKARVLEVWREEETAMAWKHVELTQKDLRATCDSMWFNGASGLTELYYSPKIYQQPREITGDRMEIYRHEQRLDSLKVFGDALVLSPADSVASTLMDRLEGQKLEIFFTDEEPRVIQVSGEALAVTFLRDENGQAGMNLARAPRMRFSLIDSELESVDMSGGVRAWWIPLAEDTPISP